MERLILNEERTGSGREDSGQQGEHFTSKSGRVTSVEEKQPPLDRALGKAVCLGKCEVLVRTRRGRKR